MAKSLIKTGVIDKKKEKLNEFASVLRSIFVKQSNKVQATQVSSTLDLRALEIFFLHFYLFLYNHPFYSRRAVPQSVSFFLAVIMTRSPLDGASISINFLSQPFPE